MFPNRRSIRLPGYDYSQPGAYFITINSHGFKTNFGAIDGDRVRLTPIGQIARDCWIEIPNHYKNTEIGPFIIMPNHIHGIIHINDLNCTGTACDCTGTACDCTGTACDCTGTACDCTGTACDCTGTACDCTGTACDCTGTACCARTFGKMIPGSLPTIVRSYKSAVSKRVNELRGTPGAEVWHRNYYEHIIQSDEEYASIAAYIEGNPVNWKENHRF